MDYLRILTGKAEPLSIYGSIVMCLEDITLLPDFIEPIYREALEMDELLLEKFRFALLRLQLHSEIHRNQDMEASQNMRFIAEMIERTVFGGLFIERENYVSE